LPLDGGTSVALCCLFALFFAAVWLLYFIKQQSLSALKKILPHLHHLRQDTRLDTASLRFDPYSFTPKGENSTPRPGEKALEKVIFG